MSYSFSASTEASAPAVLSLQKDLVCTSITCCGTWKNEHYWQALVFIMFAYAPACTFEFELTVLIVRVFVQTLTVYNCIIIIIIIIITVASFWWWWWWPTLQQHHGEASALSQGHVRASQEAYSRSECCVVNSIIVFSLYWDWNN